MRKPLLVTLGMLLGAALAAKPGFAQDGPAGKEAGRDAHLKEAVGLTEDQLAQLRQLHGEQAKAAIRRRADLRLARTELRELLDAPEIDQQAVSAKLKQLGDLEALGLKAQVDGEMALRKIVSEEQRQKLREQRQHAPGVRQGQGGRRRSGPERPERGDERGGTREGSEAERDSPRAVKR